MPDGGDSRMTHTLGTFVAVWCVVAVACGQSAANEYQVALFAAYPQSQARAGRIWLSSSAGSGVGKKTYLWQCFNHSGQPGVMGKGCCTHCSGTLAWT